MKVVHNLRASNLLSYPHYENKPIYYFNPLNPHFYVHVVKMGFIGKYIFFFFFFFISAQKLYCGYSLEPLRRGGSNGYPQSMF